MEGRSWRNLIVSVALGILAIPIIFFLFLVISPSYQVLMVRSDSMRPTFTSGDIIVCRPYGGGEIAPGEIIAFEEKGMTVTHRVVSNEGGVIRTQGDAVEEMDGWELQRSQIKGIYSFKIPVLGYLASFFHAKAGAMILIVTATLFLIYIVAAELLGSRKREKGGGRAEKPEEGKPRERERIRPEHWV
jgi:signal peptidase